MKPADVVTLSIKQADGRKKLRPALLIKEVPPFGDWIVAPLSSQLRHAVSNVDMLIDSSHPDYNGMALRSESVIRISQLQMVETREIASVIGSMNDSTFNRLLENFTNWLLEK